MKMPKSKNSIVFLTLSLVGIVPGIFGTVNSTKVFTMLCFRIFKTQLLFSKLDPGANFGRSQLVYMSCKM